MSGVPKQLGARLRKTLFWAHLATGLVAGIVIFTMAVTGVLMTYQRQLIAFAERDLATIDPPAAAIALRPEALLAKIAENVPEAPPTGFTLRRSPVAAATVNFGRERTLFIDPYTGATLGEASKLRGFMHEVEHLHRDLLLGPTGKTITGASCLAFLGLVVSGICLWWPRAWNRRALTQIAVPSLKLRGKARHWNWHNAIGIWSMLPLMVAILTGSVMSFQWANDLLFRITGNEPPPPRRTQNAAPRREPSPGKPVYQNFDQYLTRAIERIPAWQTITVRLPDEEKAPINLIIDASDGNRPDQRSQWSLNSKTGAEIRWETFDSYNLGRQLRLWTRPVHTGEALGLVGQSIAGAAALGAGILIWTGFALAWRRFRDRTSKRSQSGSDGKIFQNGEAPAGVSIERPGHSKLQTIQSNHST